MKSWYLDVNKPNVTSGFESEAITQYAKNNFDDVLLTDYADDVVLYNSDLTISKKVRCVVQNTLADTQLKSMERVCLFSVGTVKAGMYVYYDNRYWLIVNIPDNNKAYEKAVLVVCQYLLKWQDKNGKIISRWANLKSASKYNVGETTSNVLILSSDSLSILISQDSDGLTLDNKRVFIDKRDMPEKVYDITRSDDVLYDYQNNEGVLAFIADKTEFNFKTDNQELRICNYIPTQPLVDNDIPESDKVETTTTSIMGDDILKFGTYRTYNAYLYKDNIPITWDSTLYKWNVIGSNLVINITDDQIELYNDEIKNINKVIELQIIDTATQQVLCSKKIKLKENL